jgi:glycosyltransferase involved in cell wall biosynthesis
MFKPIVSICIPAYQKPQYVARCLDSILKQDYSSIEVIISDDSPGEDIKQMIKPYSGKLDIKYYHNQPPLRSPANWNAALDKAGGELVMLMHQDDWFHAADAVSAFVKAFETSPEVDFVFCRNTAVDENGREMVLQALPRLLKEMAQKPNHLVRAQVIGPPSNTMLRSRVGVRYDEQFIWLVDVDYYARLLKSGHRYAYIDRHLVSIGLHKDQTTEFVRSNDHIILKENILFAAKLEKDAFQDILIYDYYWRLLRNFKVRNLADIEKAGVEKSKISRIIHHMLKLQKKIPIGILQIGVFSKLLMTFSYITKPSLR